MGVLVLLGYINLQESVFLQSVLYSTSFYNCPGNILFELQPLRMERKWNICIKRFIGLLESTYLNPAYLIMQQHISDVVTHILCRPFNNNQFLPSM